MECWQQEHCFAAEMRGEVRHKVGREVKIERDAREQHTVTHTILQNKGDAHYAMQLNPKNKTKISVVNNKSADAQWSLHSETCSFIMPDSSVNMSR